MRNATVGLLILCCLPCWSANILPNPSFEEGGAKSATGWQGDIRKGSFEFYVSGDAYEGDRCLSIRSNADIPDGWARWFNADVYLMEGATYRLSVWAKTEGDATAYAWVPSDAKGISATARDLDDWARIGGDFTVSHTGPHGVYLQILGTGAVHYDSVSIEVIKPAAIPETSKVPAADRPIAGIVTPDVMLPHHGHLASELQRILEKMTGQSPGMTTVSNLPSDNAERMIWIGVVPPGRNYAPQLALVGEEGIVLDIGPEAIVCLGNSPRGEYYAVHELLRRLGCRWIWPGKLGEIIPQTDQIELDPALIVHRPSFDLRGGHIVQVFHTPPDWTPKHCNTAEWVDWAARNRMNRMKAGYPTMWSYGAIRGGEWHEIAGHNLHAIMPPDEYFADHPEYYPLVNGKRTHKHSSGRPAQICAANPEVRKLFADHIIDYFNTHPEAKRFGINAEDEPSYWCECDACKALDTEEIDWTENGIVGNLHITDRWLDFINDVAEMVETKYPDKLIFTFAYGSTRDLPRKVVPRRNVMIELTWWDECFKHDMTDTTCEVNVKGMERFQNWSRLASLSLYRYLDYHHVESPCPYYHAEADVLRAVHAGGCRHLSDEWDTTFASSPLLLNLRARLEWDISTDVDAFIDDFCASAYGKAGEEIARYFRLLEGAVTAAPAEHVQFNDTEKFTPEVITAGHEMLDRSEKLADSEDILGRIARLRFSLLFAELDQITLKSQADPTLFEREFEIKAALRDLVHKWQIEPSMGYYGKFSGEYKPPVDALKAEKLLQLPEMWRFKLDPDNAGEAQRWFAAVPDETWETLSTLKAWEEQGHGGYDGYAWYSVNVTMPDTADRRTWLLFEAVDETLELWINGDHVGSSDGDPGILWDKPVAVEITGKFKPGAENRLAIRVHDSAFAGGIWKPVWVTAEK